MQATLTPVHLEDHPGPYSAPLRELLDFLHLEFSVTEEAPVRMLLGALLPLDGFRPPRITLETDWRRRSFDTSAWFTLGGLVHPYSLGLVRAPGVWRRAGKVLGEAAERQRATGMASVLVEPDWQMPEQWPRAARQYAESYLGESLRVRVRQPKQVGPVNRQEWEAREAKMQYLVRGVLQPGLRSRRAPEANFPPSYAYWCELALKLVRPFPPVPWEFLSSAIAETAVRNVALEGRERADARDWQLAGEAMAWQVPVWTAGLLRVLGEGHDRKRGAPFISIGLLKSAGEERVQRFGEHLARQDGKAIRGEVQKLEQEGVLRYKATGKEWRLSEPPTCCHVLRIVEGKAFEPEQAMGPHKRGWVQRGSALDDPEFNPGASAGTTPTGKSPTPGSPPHRQ